MSSSIMPRRGECLNAGDVVKPTPDTAYRIIEITDVPGTIYRRGQWEIIDSRAAILTRPEWRQIPFTLIAPRFYTVVVESSGVANATPDEIMLSA